MKDKKNSGDLVFDGKYFNIYHEKIKMKDGIIRDFEHASCPDVVRVYPITNDNKTVLLIKEFHYSLKKSIIRAVSGKIMPDEYPQNAAFREIQEEIGYSAKSLDLISVSNPILKVDCKVYNFIARELYPSKLYSNEGECIEIFPVPIIEINNLISKNEIIEDIVAYNLIKLVNLIDELK